MAQKGKDANIWVKKFEHDSIKVKGPTTERFKKVTSNISMSEN